MGWIAAGLSVFGFAFGAYAGKAERDTADEAKPALETIAKKVKTECGCDIKVTANWDSYKLAKDMRLITSAGDSFEAAAKKQCDTPANKKALCDNLTAVTVSYDSAGGGAELKGKTLLLHSSDSGYPGESQISKITGKF
jgi:hypothetical protein